MVSHGQEIFCEKVHHINDGKIERLSDISNIIAFLRGISEQSFSFEDTVKAVSKKLKALLDGQKAPDDEKTKNLSSFHSNLTCPPKMSPTEGTARTFFGSVLNCSKFHQQLIVYSSNRTT